LAQEKRREKSPAFIFGSFFLAYVSACGY